MDAAVGGAVGGVIGLLLVAVVGLVVGVIAKLLILPALLKLGFGSKSTDRGAGSEV